MPHTDTHTHRHIPGRHTTVCSKFSPVNAIICVVCPQNTCCTAVPQAIQHNGQLDCDSATMPQNVVVVHILVCNGFTASVLYTHTHSHTPTDQNTTLVIMMAMTMTIILCGSKKSTVPCAAANKSVWRATIRVHWCPFCFVGKLNSISFAKKIYFIFWSVLVYLHLWRYCLQFTQSTACVCGNRALTSTTKLTI